MFFQFSLENGEEPGSRTRLRGFRARVIPFPIRPPRLVFRFSPSSRPSS
jgi:hypothetical protein